MIHEKIISDILNNLNQESYFRENVDFIHPRTNSLVSMHSSSFNAFNVINQEAIEAKVNFIFVDGGSSVIFECGSYCLALIRLAAVHYNYNNSVNCQQRNVYEFFLLIKSNGELTYYNKPDFLKDSSCMKTETFLEAVNSIRRLHELQLSDYFVNKYKDQQDYYIVLDGSFDSNNSNHSNNKNDNEQLIIQSWINDNDNVIGISKSSRLLTIDENGLIDTIKLMFPSKAGFFINYENNIAFAKFHDKSKFIFRLDFASRKNISNISNAFLYLSLFSKDSIFIGYPFGLFEADRVARVTNEEVKYYRSLLNTKIDINSIESNLSAHSVLDNARF